MLANWRDIVNFRLALISGWLREFLGHSHLQRSSCTTAKFSARTEIIEWFLAYDWRLERIWSNPRGVKIIPLTHNSQSRHNRYIHVRRFGSRFLCVDFFNIIRSEAPTFSRMQHRERNVFSVYNDFLYIRFSARHIQRQQSSAGIQAICQELATHYTFLHFPQLQVDPVLL